MSNDDYEDYLLRKKMLELMRKGAKAEKGPVETVKDYLYDRGDEVLDAALQQYPREASAIVEKLADLIKRGVIKDKISGGELLALFRSVGLNVYVETHVKVAKDGKLVSFSDLLKEE